jgi:hypothetical protein
LPSLPYRIVLDLTTVVPSSRPLVRLSGCDFFVIGFSFVSALTGARLVASIVPGSANPADVSRHRKLAVVLGKRYVNKNNVTANIYSDHCRPIPTKESLR